MIGQGFTDRYLSADETRQIVAEAIESVALDGKRVLVIIPDGTRTMPMPQMFAIFNELLRPRVKALDYLVALGTHTAMSEAQLGKLIGHPVQSGKAGTSCIYNHRWEDRETFVKLGVISASEIAEATGGLLSQEVVVTLNKLILDYDHIVICGPVFPHEVVGFSGGNKYFFPGIAGPEIINFTHWLGAIITNHKIIGAGYTPVRAVIDRAAAMVPRPASCFALVVTQQGVAGMYFGSAQEAWAEAARLSKKKHIIYVDKPFRRVLSVMPDLYKDLWTAAKGTYKVEPAVADGGEVIIYSPKLNEVSYTHGKLIDEIGYHCRDYFLKQWDRFKSYPGGVLAHSTHVKGLGDYQAAAGTETTRIQVTLATGIPEERCRRINLAYANPASINLDDWQGREDEGVAVIPRAGEILYRLKDEGAAAAG
jgi:nickel-dependent lactate racemase